jgi:adenosylcobyric acid synthase
MGQVPVMVLGTGSGVGKSLVVAGLCRWASNLGLRVAPFKSQNMSNNAAVLSGGGEIGRAQWLQAKASRVEPQAEMNPILLKPLGEGLSQVIFLGKPLGIFGIREYKELKKELFPKVVMAFEALREKFDLVILEGAGSPAEINLLSEDIANTRMGRAAGAKALLLGSIDQGGVYASLYGTWMLLPPKEREIIAWMGINRFRGDLSLLESAHQEITRLTGVPVIGVLEHLGSLPLPDEDSFSTSKPPPGLSGSNSSPPVRVVVVEWPHLSNRSDMDPLLYHPGVSLTFCPVDGPIPRAADLVILPGTRQTVKDLELFRKSPLFSWFMGYVRERGRVIGICGGYQMMASDILDPDGVESTRHWTPGLGILPFSVSFEQAKSSRKVSVMWQDPAGVGSDGLSGKWLSGYEIRHGRNRMHAGSHLFSVKGESGETLSGEGSMSPGGRIFGAPIHGLFENEPFREFVLNGWLRGNLSRSPDIESIQDEALDRLSVKVSRAFPIIGEKS